MPAVPSAEPAAQRLKACGSIYHLELGSQLSVQKAQGDQRLRTATGQLTSGPPNQTEIGGFTQLAALQSPTKLQ